MSDAKYEDWAFENGRERLWWDENPSTGHVVLTSPMSRPRPGYNRHQTTNPKQMDRLFNKMHEQEREHNEQFIEKLWSRGREHYEALRSNMRTRLALGSTSEAEKNIIRAAMRLMDEKDARMRQNTVQGVSALQEYDDHGYKVANEEKRHKALVN